MKTSRILSCVILSAIVLFSIWMMFKHYEIVAKNKHEQIVSPESKPNLTPNQISKSPKTQTYSGKIISDTLTSSNRIVVAEKDGVRRTAHVPLTMANMITDDQILHDLFDTNAEAPRKANLSLNPHLTFYGLVVDDQTNVVAGATITGGVLVEDGINPGRNISMTTTSDGNGYFQFDVDNGQKIWLTVNKEDYISPPSHAFQYGTIGARSIYYPDPNNPAIFILTKKQPSEKLIELRKGFTAPNTGMPVRIDLTTGQVVPAGGDLIVSITCLEPFKAGVHIPWKLVLQATGGGFAPADAGRLEYMLEAPESGYEDIVIDHPKDDPNWDSQYTGILYIKSRGGQIYGKLIFDMHTQWDERGMPFGFHSFVNPNGSKNLQNVSQ